MESFRVASWSMRHVAIRAVGRVRFPGALRQALADGCVIEFTGTATGRCATLGELAELGVKSIIVHYNNDRDTMSVPTQTTARKVVAE